MATTDFEHASSQWMMQTMSSLRTNVRGHLKSDTGKGHHILADSQLLYLAQDLWKLAYDQRVQRKIRLDAQEMKNARLVAVTSISESTVTGDE